MNIIRLAALLVLVVALAIACAPTPAPTPWTVPTRVPLPTRTPTAVAPSPTATVIIPSPTPTVVAPSPTPTAVIPSPTPQPVPTAPQPPVIQLLAPGPNQQVIVNQPIKVIAIAASDLGIIRVDLWADNALYAAQSPPGGVLLKTFQVSFDWQSATVGAHVLYVVAYDTRNNPSTPATATVNVSAATTAPVVSIQSPQSPQQIYLGQQLPIQVVATDDVGVTRLDLWGDGAFYTLATPPNPAGQTLFATTFVWTAQNVGDHVLFARAYNASGKTSDSTPLVVTVIDRRAPSLSTTYDRVYVTVGQLVQITIIAGSQFGIDSIELWADGARYSVFNSPDPRARTSVTLKQAWFSNVVGDHTLFTRAFDTGGGQADSPITVIHVSASPGS